MASDAEAALYEYVSGVIAIAELVGSRIYPLELPQEVDYPAILYFRVDTPRFQAFSGPAGLAHPRFQFSIFSEKYADLPAIALQLRLALDGLSQTVGGFTIGAVQLDNEHDEPFEPETKTYQRILDFIVWHNE